MSAAKGSPTSPVRVNVRIYPADDPDLHRVLTTVPSGHRSAYLRSLAVRGYRSLPQDAANTYVYVVADATRRADLGAQASVVAPVTSVAKPPMPAPARLDRTQILATILAGEAELHGASG